MATNTVASTLNDPTKRARPIAKVQLGAKPPVRPNDIPEKVWDGWNDARKRAITNAESGTDSDAAEIGIGISPTTGVCVIRGIAGRFPISVYPTGLARLTRLIRDNPERWDGIVKEYTTQFNAMQAKESDDTGE